MIKIFDAERHRGGVRITLACGMDALDDYRLRQESVTEVSRLLSAKRDEIAPAVSRMINEQEKAKERIAMLSAELISLRATACAETDGNICLFDSLLDEIAQRELVNLLMPKCKGFAAVFCGNDKDGYRYVIGSRNIDLRKNARAINELISGRGGGRPEMISGRASSRAEDILNALNTTGF